MLAYLTSRFIMRVSFTVRITLFLLALSLAAGLPAAMPAKATDDAVSLLMRQQVEQLHFGEQKLLGTASIYTAGLLLELYRKNQFQLLWTNKDTINQLRSAIIASAEEGLIPDDYHLQAINRLSKEMDQTVSTATQVEYDIILADALLLLGQHKRFGKVDPAEVEERKNLKPGLPRATLLDAHLNSIQTGTVRAALDALTPNHQAYVHLKKALNDYRKLSSTGGWSKVPPGPSLRPGMQDDRIKALRNRLMVTGELKQKGADPTLYDDSVMAAVKAFQLRHHLEPDGVAGKSTIDAMNVTAAERVNQIRVNLERARWIFHDMPSSSIIIDIAGFMLQYYHEKQPAWRTKVMVGQPFNQTPIFRSAITYLVLNPTWTIPPEIVKNETIPRILLEKNYLAKQHLRILTSTGEEVNPASVPWRQFMGKYLPYTLRQDPGEENSLGLIKFIFPNPHHVYLHDTPSKALFDRTQRAFSHGCIRVQNPLELGRMLLTNDLGNPVNEAKFNQILSSGKTTTVILKQPLPIYLMYLTANVQEGRVMFKPDLYLRDQSIFEALNAQPTPVQPEELSEVKERPVTADSNAEKPS